MLAAAAAEVAGWLAAAGVAATTDPERLTLPGALVVPSRAAWDGLDGATLSVTWQVWLIGQALPPSRVLGQIDDMLGALKGAGINPGTLSFEAISAPNIAEIDLAAVTFTLESIVESE